MDRVIREIEIVTKYNIPNVPQICSIRQMILNHKKCFYIFYDSIIAQENLLQTAQRNIDFFKSRGVLGQNRDFRNCIDINLSALQVLKNNRGFILESEWDYL